MTQTPQSGSKARLIQLAFILNASFVPAFAQSELWAGYAQCTTTASGPFRASTGTGNFFYTETQTWAMTNEAPTQQGAIQTLPATWTVTGHGFKDTPTSNGGFIRQNLVAAWSESNPLKISQNSNSNWNVEPTLLTGIQRPGLKIDASQFSVFQWSFPVPANSTTLPLEASSHSSALGPFVAQQPSDTRVEVTRDCQWNIGPPTGGSRFVPLTNPCRIVDTRNSRRGGAVVYPLAPATFKIEGVCGIPSTASAYSLHVTASPTRPLYSLAIRPSGGSPYDPALMLLTAPDGLATGNAVIVPKSPSGSVDVVVSDPTNVIIDVNGYFDDVNPAGLVFYPIAPCRAVDAANGSLSAGTARAFAVGSNCGIPSNAGAYALNVTVIPTPTLSFLTVWPTGQPQPIVSTSYAQDGQTKTNLAIVAAGTGGNVSFVASDAANIAVDVTGYFAPAGNPGGLKYLAFPNWCVVAESNTTIAGGASRDFALWRPSGCGLPYWAKAYFLNVVAVASGPTSLKVWPKGQAQPSGATVSAVDGQMTANTALVPAGSDNGSISVFASSTTNVMVAVGGYFLP